MRNLRTSDLTLDPKLRNVSEVQLMICVISAQIAQMTDKDQMRRATTYTAKAVAAFRKALLSPNAHKLEDKALRDLTAFRNGNFAHERNTSGEVVSSKIMNIAEVDVLRCTLGVMIASRDCYKMGEATIATSNVLTAFEEGVIANDYDRQDDSIRDLIAIRDGLIEA